MMKVILLSFVLFAVAIPKAAHAATAAASQTLGLDIAAGFKSDYGLLGVGARYFFYPHLDLHANVGADLAGGMYGIGSRVYTSPLGDTCWFVIPCRPQVHASVFFGTTAGSRAKITEDNNPESQYRIGHGNFASIGIGSYDVYGWFTNSLEIGYRNVYNKPKITHESGPDTQKARDLMKATVASSIYASISFGVLL